MAPDPQATMYTKFGVAGHEILSNRLILLHPFELEPTIGDLDVDLAGAPIAGQYTYQRRPTTDAEVDLNTNQLVLPLSTLGNTTFRDDRKISNDSKRRFSDQDTEYFDHLYTHISLASHTVVKTHANYQAYQLLPIGARSYAFDVTIRDIHSIGNAANKLHRTCN